MTMLTPEAVSTALDKMSTMLAADGYQLAVQVEGESVALDVRATPEACAECLVPKPILASMASDLLQKAGLPLDASAVQLTYPTEH